MCLRRRERRASLPSSSLLPPTLCPRHLGTDPLPAPQSVADLRYIPRPGVAAADAAAVPRILLEQRAERGAAVLLDVPEGGWRLSGARLPTGLQPGSRARTWLAAISPTCSGVISSESISAAHTSHRYCCSPVDDDRGAARRRAWAGLAGRPATVLDAEPAQAAVEITGGGGVAGRWRRRQRSASTHITCIHTSLFHADYCKLEGRAFYLAVLFFCSETMPWGGEHSRCAPGQSS